MKAKKFKRIIVRDIDKNVIYDGELVVFKNVKLTDVIKDMFPNYKDYEISGFITITVT